MIGINRLLDKCHNSQQRKNRRRPLKRYPALWGITSAWHCVSINLAQLEFHGTTIAYSALQWVDEYRRRGQFLQVLTVGKHYWYTLFWITAVTDMLWQANFRTIMPTTVRIGGINKHNGGPTFTQAIGTSWYFIMINSESLLIRHPRSSYQNLYLYVQSSVPFRDLPLSMKAFTSDYHYLYIK